MTLITDEMMDAALQYLATSTQKSAKAKADRVMAEHRRKQVRARLFLEAPEGAMAMKEAWAEAHIDYALACEEEGRAVEADEYHRAARVKAEAIIEAWRTENANIRAAERIR